MLEGNKQSGAYLKGNPMEEKIYLFLLLQKAVLALN